METAIGHISRCFPTLSRGSAFRPAENHSTSIPKGWQGCSARGVLLHAWRQRIMLWLLWKAVWQASNEPELTTASNSYDPRRRGNVYLNKPTPSVWHLCSCLPKLGNNQDVFQRRDTKTLHIQITFSTKEKIAEFTENSEKKM